MTHSRPQVIWSSCVLALLFSAFFTVHHFAFDVPLRVQEKACRLQFEESLTKASLAFENNSSRTLPAQFKLELLDSSGYVRARASRDDSIKSGSSMLTFDLPEVAINATNRDKLWWRLHYVITPQDEAIAPLEGYISASEITPDIFALQVFGARVAWAGERYQVRVRTAHPITGQPVGDVKIAARASYELNQKERASKANAITNQDGYAVVTFDLPTDFGEDDDNDFNIEVTAQKGSLTRTEDVELDLIQEDRYIVTTDKTLYQPGQTIHTRVVIFDQQKRARSDYEMDAVIEDAEEQKVFRTKLKTSKFGVAFFDWKIPDNTKLGGYKITIGNPTPTRIWGEAHVKVSRYDLPTFAVKVKPNQSYYLPNENAEVEVKADYLFGQPVTRGTVKVVREADRTWNYKTYKYDIEEGETWRGETDASGKFIVKIDLKEQHEKFEPNDYRKFEDLHFAAYFTDTTTGRTEQRKFDLRVTKDPIHVYWIGDYNYAAQQPIKGYVNASYADGTPAQCEVTISQMMDGGDSAKKLQKTLTTISTNKYGLAKVTGLRRIMDANDDTADPELVFQVRDAQGKTGKLEKEISITGKGELSLTTDKSLYRVGEAIQATINASDASARVVLEVLQDNRVISSQLLTLKQGVASAKIPYHAELRDEVTLIVYANVLEGDDTRFMCAARAVLYPRDRELNIQVNLPRNEYQPGEEARADLLVKTADGKPVNSVLGVSIVDTAVGERERSDNNFRGHQSYYGYYYGDTSIAGFTRRELDKLDTKRPFAPEMDLVAEVLLKNSINDHINSYHDSDYDRDPRSLFAAYFDEQFRPLKSYLEREYTTNAVYPKALTTLRNMLRRVNIEPDELRDPWGMPYRIGFSTHSTQDEMELRCAGADKAFDTDDDFTALNISRLYFKFTGEAINRAVANYQARTGDYIRDGATLKSELKREGIEFDALRDPWGTAYHITLQQRYDSFYLVVRSAGKDQRLSTDKDYSADDVEVWAAKLDYFSDIRYQIAKALDAYYKANNRYPSDDATFRAAMQLGGVDFDALRDPLGHRFYVMLSTQSSFVDKTEIITYSKFGEKAQNKTQITPITQTLFRISLRGAGSDDKEGTPDDFAVTTFDHVLTEQASTDAAPVRKAANTNAPAKRTSAAALLPPGQSGTITGTVTDSVGAAVPNAAVIAKRKTATAEYNTTSNDAGIYSLRGLPPDLYDVSVTTPGFKKYMVADVRVVAGETVVLDVKLEVGTTTETVNVSAEAPALQTTSASMASVVVTQVQSLPINARKALDLVTLQPGATSQNDISTPRLREYFPETLLWQPNLETDKQGRASLKFKLADNITTWKMALIGTTIDGQIGTAETDIRAFQPFFAELDPPKVLTEGDEIALPIVLRNYLDKAQSVDLQFKPEPWFTLLSPARKRSEVKANDSAKEIFDFRAIASTKAGKQRVTAIGSTNSDAIEKTVNVHHDGEELAITTGNVFGAAGALDLNVPADAIKGSVQAELKIYPNLLAHVTEGIEGILQRPYGCGEQTVSSTYPNVMALRLLKSTGQGEEGRTAAIATKARKYAQAGYDRLLGYRDASGGFKYWSGNGGPDLALTAYALRFLHDASEVIEIKDEVIEEAQAWLLKQQQPDGRWAAKDYYGAQENARRSVMYTALIARALTSGGALSKEDDKALQKAFAFLAPKLAEFSEPYALANYALAAQQAGDKPRANWAVAQLRALPLNEAGAVYWALETNTPFYGWGLAGRIETTALVIKALKETTGDTRSTGKSTDNDRQGSGITTVASSQSSPVPPVSPVVDNNELLSQGVYWLLRNKDRYGVWLSTQATINVLDAFISLNDAKNVAEEVTAEILLNGQRVYSVKMPPSHELSNPISIDLSPHLTTGNNRIEIKRPANAALASAQLVETFYLPWSKSLATQEENFKAGKQRALHLAVSYDKPEARIGEDITCNVEAERIGSSGYGMMLAEIGLPPGAEVDRASLELAATKAGYDINHYEVLPDRVVLYLWPRAGGVRFAFKFKLRYGVKAMTTASLLYDYYNPEARAVVAPTRVVVR